MTRLFRPTVAPSWLNDVLRSIERELQGVPYLTSLPTYADDAAAGTGGLAAGQFYRTSAGAVMVKL